MADPITERTAELEQGLKDFQTEIDRRATAPPLPLSKPLDAVDPNAQPTPTFTQVSVPPQAAAAPASAPAPEESQPPTWDQVKADPGYQSAPPAEKLVAFSRWHDAVYNVLSKHPDWEANKDAFNQGAADEQNLLSKDAGGLTPDQARVQVAADAIHASPHGQASRDALAKLGPDITKAYYDHIQDPDKDSNDWDFGQGMGTDIVKASLSKMSQGLIGAAKGAASFVAPPIELPKDAKPGDVGYDLIKSTNEKISGFNDFMKTWRDEVPKGLGVKEGTTGTEIGEFAGGLVPYFAALPAAVVSHMGESYGDSFDKSGNKLTAATSAAWAGLTDIMFMKLGELTSGLGKGIENPLGRWAASLSAGTAGNLTASQLIKAGQAAIDAPAGKRYDAFKAALEEIKPSDAGVQAAFALLATKHSETARAEAAAKQVVDTSKQVADNARAAGAPQVAKVTEDQAAQTAQQVKQAAEQAPPPKAVEKVAKAVAKKTAEAAPAEITLEHVTGDDGELTPKANIPPDATIADLQAAKKEVNSSYKKDSADANEFHRQLDEAIAAKEKEFAPAEAKTTGTEPVKPVEPTKPEAAPAAAEVSDEEVKARQKQNEQHLAFRAERAVEPTSVAGKAVVEALKNENLKDLSYDGKGMVGEQLTELDPHSPSWGASFEVPTNASLHDIIEKRIEVRDRFAGEPEAPAAPATAAGERELSKDEHRAINKEAYAKAQEVKRAAGNNKDFNVNAEFEKQRAAMVAKAKAAAPKPTPKAGEGATRAERSASNKAAHKAAQQEASAARKAARAERGDNAEAIKQTTEDTIKRGTLPTADELKEAHPDMDITTATDLRQKLQGELTKAYPPEELPKGAKIEHIPHEYTKEDLPMISEKGADGVERTRPQFTNDPEITAQQKDAGLFSDDAGNRLYIPDELFDNEKVNPAIGDSAKWDPEKKQFYVSDVDTSLGRVSLSHEEALGQQGSTAKEQQNSYTQLRQERDAFGKAHAQLAVGDKLEAVNEAVQQKMRDRGLADDAVNFNYHSDPLYEGQPTDVETKAAPQLDTIQFPGQRRLAEMQLAEADKLGLLQKDGGPPVNLNHVLDNILKDPKSTPQQKMILQLVKDTGYDLSKLKTEVVSVPNETWGARMHHDEGMVRFNISGGQHLGGVKTSFIHEMFHHILDGKMHPDAPRNAAEQRAYDAIVKLHDQVSRAIFEARKGRPPESASELKTFQEAQFGRARGEKEYHKEYIDRDYYALGNPYEFVTETLTNPKWQNILNNLDSVLNLAPKERSLFGKIIDVIRNHVMVMFSGKEVSKTSPLRHALDNMFDQIAQGPNTEAGGLNPSSIYDRQMKQYRAQLAEYHRLIGEAAKPEEVRDRQGLNRADRSKINKAAYKAAQEVAKEKGKGFDVMKEYERQRDQIMADFKRTGLATAPETLTAEGRAKLAEVNARQAEEAKAGEAAKDETGMSADELNAEITGKEPAPVSPDKYGSTISKKIRIGQDGWVMPDGRYLNNDQFVGSNRVQGIEAPQFGGHEGTAWDHIMQDPELSKDFESWAKDKGFEHLNELGAADIKDFMESKGYLRILHDGRNIYFTGDPRKNPAGMAMLTKHAINNERSLHHDREVTGPNSLKTMYEPPTHAFESAAATEPAEEEPNAKVRYTRRAGGRRNISIEGVPNKAQVEATMKLIDEDTGSSDTVKSALKDQVALAAKQQEPVLVDRVQVKVPIKGNTVLKDTGADTIVAGANSATNIPQILAQQGANKVALDYGSAKKPTKEVSQDRAASTLITDHGKDLHELEVGRDQVANGAESGKKFLPVYDYAIENFDRLKGKTAHDTVMKDQAEREQTYDIPTKIVENYVTRQLESPDMSDNDVIGVPNGKGGTRYFTKARSFETLSDAISAGFTPKTLDIVDLDAMRIEAGERLIQQKILHESLKSVLAPDGKPIIGTTEPRQTLYHGEEQVVPKGYQQVQVPGGGSIVVHSDYAPLIEAMYGKSYTGAFARWAGFMKKNTLILDTFHVGRILMKQAAFSKGVDRGPMAYQKGLSLLEYKKEDLNKALEIGDISAAQHKYAMDNYEDAQALIRNGLNVGKMSDNMNAELIKGIPYLRNFNPWVFSKLSRGAMLQTALANLERNQSRFGGELSRDEVLRRTSKEMNEVFGNLNMQSVIKNKQFQSSIRAILLAPQWAESQLKSELRGYGQLLKAPIDLARGNARLGVVAQGQATAVLGMFAAMQVASLILNGHTTFQNKKGDWLNIHIPGGRAGFEFNPLEIGAEYAFMAARYRSQHMQIPDIAQRIAFNKLNPLPHGVLNWILNRDYSGKRFADWADRNRALAESVIPLPPLFSAGLERDPRQKGLLSTNQDELKAVRGPADAGRLILHTAGIRPTRYPGALEKSLLQSSGIKVSAAQTPRTEMFALSQPYHDDKSYGDNAPPVYRELRAALDNRNDHAVREEITLLASRGATEDQIRKAVGVTHGGIAPEKFTGKAALEHLFVKSLTPDQRKVYNEAQADHKANAHLLISTLSQMKTQDTELVKQLHKNRQKPKASDFQN